MSQFYISELVHMKSIVQKLTSFYEHFPIEPVETRFPLIETFREDFDCEAHY